MSWPTEGLSALSDSSFINAHTTGGTWPQETVQQQGMLCTFQVRETVSGLGGHDARELWPLVPGILGCLSLVKACVAFLDFSDCPATIFDSSAAMALGSPMACYH